MKCGEKGKKKDKEMECKKWGRNSVNNNQLLNYKMFTLLAFQGDRPDWTKNSLVHAELTELSKAST